MDSPADFTTDHPGPAEDGGGGNEDDGYEASVPATTSPREPEKEDKLVSSPEEEEDDYAVYRAYGDQRAEENTYETPAPPSAVPETGGGNERSSRPVRILSYRLGGLGRRQHKDNGDLHGLLWKAAIVISIGCNVCVISLFLHDKAILPSSPVDNVNTRVPFSSDGSSDTYAGDNTHLHRDEDSQQRGLSNNTKNEAGANSSATKFLPVVVPVRHVQDRPVTVSATTAFPIGGQGSKPRDCLDIRLTSSGWLPSSAYLVHPRDGLGPIMVYCDMDTDGGGWTVIQKRYDGSVDFSRGWYEYKRGFPTYLSGEFWLGNDNIHRLTVQDSYELRVDMESFDDDIRYAVYARFSVGGEEELYKLDVAGFSGNVTGDSLGKHDGSPFATVDHDSEWGCAQAYQGGWWYYRCHSASLNGQYLRGYHSTWADGIHWDLWTGMNHSLRRTEMKIRPHRR
ncbi:FIBCD1 [Branchiostoma lanceolatum]|uniref:FIBCD1 protein n=1 Tax=Branchiostoma lanceolatum TaxID=7740 RepID=A0A8J9ZU80_BRALA|nr:FIBCD1 [Branchiostoma lanceolatum]